MMSNDSFLLTPQERDRFATWLERQAESSKAMIAQFETLPPAVAEVMVAKEKQELAAYIIIARMLRSTEDMSIG